KVCYNLQINHCFILVYPRLGIQDTPYISPTSSPLSAGCREKLFNQNNKSLLISALKILLLIWKIKFLAQLNGKLVLTFPIFYQKSAYDLSDN
ncbi:MAG: hypothetical protein P8H90_03180, partial [Tateyamaria sp.]|nr:hypothetical protein [Tateyamaria sp.]